MKVIIALTFSAMLCLAASVSWSAEMDCQMCHQDKAEGKSVHAAVSMGCGSCHSGVDATEIPHKFAEGTTKGLPAEGAEVCAMCHDLSAFSGKKYVHMPVSGGMCTSCHDPHASAQEKLLLSEAVCFNCHDSGNFIKKEVVHAPVGGNLCGSCHSPHQSDIDKLLVDPMPNVCFTCHDKTNFYGPTIHAPVGLGLCTTCHKPHQSENRKLLKAVGQDLCYTCHDKAEFNKKGSVHKPVSEGRCLFCHQPHAGQNEGLVYRKGNILCRRCHPDIERKPHAVSGFSAGGHPLRGRKDPNRPRKTFGCLSCHVPHSSDSMALFRFKANDMFTLCTYCHEM